MDIHTYLSLFSTIAIVCAGAFAGVQLRQLYKQRERDSALHMLRSFQTPEFTAAVNIIFDLPDGLSRKEIEGLLGEKMKDVMVMFGTFESLGIMVFHREIRIELVDDFFSGIIILSWKKFRRYMEEVRTSAGRDTYYEWAQWLAEQFERRESEAPAQPAYQVHRDWKE